MGGEFGTKREDLEKAAQDGVKKGGGGRRTRAQEGE